MQAHIRVERPLGVFSAAVGMFCAPESPAKADPNMGFLLWRDSTWMFGLEFQTSMKGLTAMPKNANRRNSHVVMTDDVAPVYALANVADSSLRGFAATTRLESSQTLTLQMITDSQPGVVTDKHCQQFKPRSVEG